MELDSDAGNQITARIALGGAAHKPWRTPKAEAMLISKVATIQTCHLAADVHVRHRYDTYAGANLIHQGNHWVLSFYKYF